MTGTVLVTGSSRGIGQAIALRMAQDGFDVVVHCRTGLAEAEAVASQIRGLGRQARVLQFDVADRALCKSVLEADILAHGCYYGVVHNAGLTRDNAFPAMNGEDWDLVLSANLDSFYNVLHPLVMPMVRRKAPGRIVTLASVAGLMGNRGQTNYAAAKAGVIAASKSLAIELGKRAITVNCIAPGVIATEMTKDLPEEQLLEMIPLRRYGKPEEVAALASFLLSDQAAYITRQVFTIDGGLSS